MELDWTNYKAADIKTLTCTCGNVFLGHAQTVEGVTYCRKPCSRCVKTDAIVKVEDKSVYWSLKP
jgi:hypothetical protein